MLRRVLLSYGLLILCFSAVAGWAALALRAATRDAELMRVGYLPLAVAVEEAIASQDNWNAQLNHVTSADNPSDKQEWFASTLRAGRPRVFQAVRDALERAFVGSSDPRVQAEGLALLAESRAVEASLQNDRVPLEQLFHALDTGDAARAEALRTELVSQGNAGLQSLRRLGAEIDRQVDGLIAEARERSATALRLLIGLAALTALVGVVMALYARRALAPLSDLTERAEVVARGDLTPRPALAARNEIGELARTFEDMVAAIARAHAELVRTERLAAIGNMAARVTHEIRNPLSSIALNVELLEEELGPSGEARALVRAIASEVERLVLLSEQYLTLARQQPLRVAPEDLGELCEEVAALVTPELARRGCSLVLDVAPGLPAATLDEAQLRQVLLNLLRNGREAMPAGGTLRLVASSPEPGFVELAVEDEGEGVPEEIRARLFEAFFTTKPSGTGLGLAITRQLVEAHGGTIRCEPRQPRGSRFVVRLPLAGPPERGSDGPSGEPGSG